MVIVLIPAGHQVDSSQWSESREKLKLTGQEFSDKVLIEMSSYFYERDIPYFDLTQDFRNYLEKHPDAKIYYDKDWYLTPLGHEIVGKSISDFLINLIQKSSMRR